MERLTILVGRLYKSVTPTNYFVKVPLIVRFMPLVSGIGQLVEPPLESHLGGSSPIVVTFPRVLSLN